MAYVKKPKKEKKYYVEFKQVFLVEVSSTSQREAIEEVSDGGGVREVLVDTYGYKAWEKK